MLDLRLGNILLQLPTNINKLSIDKVYAEYRKPETVRVTQHDGKPLLSNVPSKAMGTP